MAKVENIRPDKVTIMLDKMRTMQLDMNALIEIEKRYGSVQAGFELLKSNKIEHIRFMLWTTLIHEETRLDDITQEPIGYNLSMHAVGKALNNLAIIKEATEKLTQVIVSSMPEGETMQENASTASYDANASGVATVVLTDEEKRAQEEERKNG